MKIYKHEGKGIWLGSTIIVKAKDLETAKVMIRKELDENGLKDEPLDIEEVTTDIIHVYNGDY
ncbi:MAG TPA: hypothetical protein VNR38_00900 [Ureibacillus sp.]|nr:hypothetical protein [Ureibacillus sp.]